MAFRPDLSAWIPFRDRAACERVRRIRKSEITKHPNPKFRIEVIEDKVSFYSRFALDIVGRIREADAAGRTCVLILPVGPVPQYDLAARMINRLGISCRRLITFNMDEYADEDGRTAPPDWEGSFATSMRKSFFSKIDAKLRPADRNIHFPTDRNIEDYWKLIEDAGGADCCYGGIGWCGHIAFWESHLGHEFKGDLAAYKKAHGRIVELNPMTIMQNALHTFGGDWSWVPPKAASIGPREILGARDRSFWLDGDCAGPGMSWQRFIARLAAHGPVNEFVPGSILQEAKGGYHILGSVAEDVRIDFA
jgi:glucosamine-6-phosphate deaminase